MVKTYINRDFLARLSIGVLAAIVAYMTLKEPKTPLRTIPAKDFSYADSTCDQRMSSADSMYFGPRTAFSKAEWMSAARQYGLTGMTALFAQRQVSEMKPQDYRPEGLIAGMAEIAGVNLGDETQEPARFRKNGINDLVTADQAEGVYEFLNMPMFPVLAPPYDPIQ